MFDAVWFFDLEKQIRALGADSDDQSFDEIRDNLAHPRRVKPDEFAAMCAYVILAGGFSQKTAKRIHKNIMEYIYKNGADYGGLYQCFIMKIKSRQFARFGKIVRIYAMVFICVMAMIKN